MRYGHKSGCIQMKADVLSSIFFFNFNNNLLQKALRGNKKNKKLYNQQLLNHNEVLRILLIRKNSGEYN